MVAFSKRRIAEERSACCCRLLCFRRRGPLALLLLLCLVVVIVYGSSSPPLMRGTDTQPTTPTRIRMQSRNDTTKHSYDPTNCPRMVNGHCQDAGAWSYRNDDGTCTHTEENAPRDWTAAAALPLIFPHVTSVLDFGGGPGAWLLAFRDTSSRSLDRTNRPSTQSRHDLVVMEPRPLGPCLFANLTQDTTDLCNTPLVNLPFKNNDHHQQYDLVLTIEVVEHIPVHLHAHVVDALTLATRHWLVWSAAHPGQPGEGHVGPSMKTKAQWMEDIVGRGVLVVDENKTQELYQHAGSLIQANAIVFRRKSSRTS